MALKSRILGLVVVAGLLSACGSVHPGAAAVVNGERITMQEADSIAPLYCLVQLAGQQESAVFDNAQIRREALSSLIFIEVADQLAAEKNLTVKVSDDLGAPAEAFREALDPEFRDDFDSLMEQNLRFGAIAIALGRSVAPDVADENELLNIGMGEIGKALGESDIDIDPRFGINAMGEQIADSGSLSAMTVNLDRSTADTRAAATLCSAV